MISLILHSSNELFTHPTLYRDSRDQTRKWMEGTEMEGNGIRSGTRDKGRKKRSGVGKGGKERKGMDGKRKEE